MKVEVCRLILVGAFLGLIALPARGQVIRGTVVDTQNGEVLIGALVSAEGTSKKAVTDENGEFELKSLKRGATYTIVTSYIGYNNDTISNVVTRADGDTTRVRVGLSVDEQVLGEASVTAARRSNTQAAMIKETKESSAIVSNISAQEISRSQDTNAGEVIRRVPGVSLIDDKFVMVRGLSQRYNNVWINGGAVPSSEADSRAFSFDMLPSSQIENLTIVKNPTPEYPADYSGGFIKITTKDIPEENSFNISAAINMNDATVFSNFDYSKGSGTDFLGFDNGFRSLEGGIDAQLNAIGDDGVDLLNNGFNNDWTVKDKKPFGDIKISADMSRQWKMRLWKLGMLLALNYTNEYRSYTDMENNLYGVYDDDNDKKNYLRKAVDNQYNNNVRIGAMANFTLLSNSGKNKFQFKNIFNQIGNSRYTWREGTTAQSDEEHSAEYYYRSRTTYNGQITGKHTFKLDELDWSAAYSYANRCIPDRRRYSIDDALETGVLALTKASNISREWTRLDEHIISLQVNEKHDFTFGSFTPSLKAGVYGEYRTRTYKTRSFIYNYNYYDNNLPSDFRYMDIPTLLSSEEYMGEDMLYLLEEQQMRNNYRGHNRLGAAYLSATLPFNKLEVLAGVRFEYNDMELISNTRDDEVSEKRKHYRTRDFFPSASATYKFTDEHQLRFSYGRSINRPEFREVSSSVYYDFDLASSVMGNTELESCYIDNLDLRYEFYPSQGEMISVAVFYKHFDSPIEWTYTVSGGTDLIYSYENAESANNFGVEVDIRKDLSFIGLRNLSWSFNAAWIHSRVHFSDSSLEENRPMQGQSPYLINTGFFYKHPTWGLDISVLYNVIGKRIIGVGRSEGTTGSDDNARVPDSYEMPRNVIDLSATKQLGRHWEINLGIKDLIAQKVYYKQFADTDNGEVEQIVKSYKPGRNILLKATYKF